MQKDILGWKSSNTKGPNEFGEQTYKDWISQHKLFPTHHLYIHVCTIVINKFKM